MILKIRADDTVILDQPSDFKRFKASVDRPQSAYQDVIGHNLNVVRFQDSATAWVTIEGIIALSGNAQNAEWLASLQDMLVICEKMGWLSADRREVQVHVEWAST